MFKVYDVQDGQARKIAVCSNSMKAKQCLNFLFEVKRFETIDKIILKDV